MFSWYRVLKNLVVILFRLGCFLNQWISQFTDFVKNRLFIRIYSHFEYICLSRNHFGNICFNENTIRCDDIANRSLLIEAIVSKQILKFLNIFRRKVSALSKVNGSWYGEWFSLFLEILHFPYVIKVAEWPIHITQCQWFTSVKQWCLCRCVNGWYPWINQFVPIFLA